MTAGVLGLCLSPTKLLQGATLELLGILVDTVTGPASVTNIHLHCIISNINTILDRKTASGIKLSSVAGHLVFITCICPPGKASL
jgi:hypothetical protein